MRIKALAGINTNVTYSYAFINASQTGRL